MGPHDAPAAGRDGGHSYQIGDASQFKKAWSALATGKTQEFSDETRVFYKNKAGERVEDKRARELRASMLAGAAD